MKILLTGTAGFIGFHVANHLIENGYELIGLDNINNYYDVRLKYSRLSLLGIERETIEWNRLCISHKYPNFRFIQANLEDREAIRKLFETEKFDRVCNLAAQAGVRYSLENPYAYIQSNVNGFLNMLEGCRNNEVGHLVYASSSSVYGLNEKVPFSEKDGVAHPVSLYAATKKANELMAHSYSHLYGIPTTGLRFFTVYGPWGRPDMSPLLFTDAILRGKPIKIFNQGDMLRDFTYIDDIVENIARVINTIPVPNVGWSGKNPDPSSSPNPYRIYNIGNSSPVRLMDFIECIEEAVGKKAIKEFLPMQPGDVYQTNAETTLLEKTVGFKPDTPLESGIRKTVAWFREYYKL